MKINVGSLNPNKINSVKEVWQEYSLGEVDVQGINVPSDVPQQPTNLTHIIQGATNRAKNAFQNSDLSIGIESGLMPAEGTRTGYLGLCACAIYDGKETYIGLGEAFEYPTEITQRVIEKDMEIDDAFKEAGFTDNPRIGYSNGVIGWLTNNKITRKDLAKTAVKMALVSFLNKELYKKTILFNLQHPCRDL